MAGGDRNRLPRRVADQLDSTVAAALISGGIVGAVSLAGIIATTVVNIRSNEANARNTATMAQSTITAARTTAEASVRNAQLAAAAAREERIRDQQRQTYEQLMGLLSVWDLRRDWARDPTSRNGWPAEQQKYVEDRCNSAEVFELSARAALYASSPVRDAIHDYLAAARAETFARGEHERLAHEALVSQDPDGAPADQARKAHEEAQAMTDSKRQDLEELLRNEVGTEQGVMGGRQLLEQRILRALEKGIGRPG